MKVLMIPSWYPMPVAPLLGTFFREQAEAMAAQGVDMAVIHVRVGLPGDNGIRCERKNGVLTYTYTRSNLTPGSEKGRCWQRKLMLERLYRRLEREWGRPDVVNLRSSLHGYEAVALCRRHNLPLFFMEHSSCVITDVSPAVQQRLRTVMETAAVNACVSSAVREVMQPYGDTRIIPDPVDGSVFYPKEVPSHDFFLFRAMGQLRSIKGYDTLIRAFALVKQRTGRDVRLEIAGGGALRDSLQALIDSLGIGSSCTLVGRVPRAEAVDYMNGCDCFVCSSRVETLSCVLNEAAACGKPVISTRCGGPLDIVTDDSGVLVGVDDPEAMAQAMLTMLDSAGQYDGARIREQTLSRFGREKVVAQLIQACRDACLSAK